MTADACSVQFKLISTTAPEQLALTEVTLYAKDTKKPIPTAQMVYTMSSANATAPVGNCFDGNLNTM